jgi:hypothetical protein
MAGYKKPQGPRAIYHEEAKIYGSEVYTYNKIPRNAPPYVGKIGLGCIRDIYISNFVQLVSNSRGAPIWLVRYSSCLLQTKV